MFIKTIKITIKLYMNIIHVYFIEDPLFIIDVCAYSPNLSYTLCSNFQIEPDVRKWHDQSLKT